MVRNWLDKKLDSKRERHDCVDTKLKNNVRRLEKKMDRIEDKLDRVLEKAA